MSEKILIHDGLTKDNGEIPSKNIFDGKTTIIGYVGDGGAGVRSTLKSMLENDEAMPTINVPNNFDDEVRYAPSSFVDTHPHRMILNPNKTEAMNALSRLYQNHGNCPSKDDESSLIDNRCPCSDMIVHSRCKCGLFVREDEV